MALRDSSDFRQALDLLRTLAGPAAPVRAIRPAGAYAPAHRPAIEALPPVVPDPRPSGRFPAAAPAPMRAMPEPAAGRRETGEVLFLGDEIADILRGMCRRGGFAGAVLADASGLPLADFNCPVDPDAVAACSSVLGDAMRQAGRLLRQNEANNISMDINYVDKVALRRFELFGAPYYVMVICPQHVDERSEVEVSIDRLVEVLGRGSRAVHRVPENLRSQGL